MRTFILLAFFCGSLTGQYNWNLPRGFKPPQVPADNPMSDAKVELGRRLFYDNRLSTNSKGSCATCHEQQYGFVDRKPVAEGVTGEKHPRRAMPLANIAYFGVLTWADPTQTVLENQARVPLFGTHPIELGLKEDSKPPMDAAYQKMFAAAFPSESAPWTFVHVTKALASFERTLISGNSPYDRYRLGDESAISESAKRGEDLFFHQPQSCSRCHGGLTFGGTSRADPEFFNTGLYNPFPADNTGIAAHTHKPEDIGKFRAASLRNVAVRAPYMHDGSIATLNEVLDHYAAGGRSHNPDVNRFIGGFTLTAEQRADLIEFLKSLTDEEFLHDPRFSDPWKTAPPTR